MYMGENTMTHAEMSNFTYEELENFSHLELSLKNTKILLDIINDFRDDIPSCIIIKLERICKSFVSSCEENNIEIPTEITKYKSKDHLTLAEIATIIQAIIAIITLALSLFSKNETTNNANNNAYINQITNYAITAEYNTDTTVIINELEQTYNIYIDIDDTSINPDAEN